MIKTVDAELGQKARTDTRFDDLEVTFEFQDIIPKNIGEMNDNLSKATEGRSSMNGDAEYLLWDRTPESVKTEYEILKEIAHNQTYTPDLSFNNVKGLGNQLSGIVFEFMFMDAKLKSTTKQEMLTEGLQRRVSLLKEMVKTVDAEIGQKARTDPWFDNLEVSFEFQDIMPKNIVEMIENISKATEGKASMSRKRAVELNPLIDDPKEEMVQLGKEIQEEQESMLPEGDSYDYKNLKNR